METEYAEAQHWHAERAYHQDKSRDRERQIGRSVPEHYYQQERVRPEESMTRYADRGPQERYRQPIPSPPYLSSLPYFVIPVKAGILSCSTVKAGI